MNSPGRVSDGGALVQEVPTTLNPGGHGPGVPLHSVETVNTWPFAILGWVFLQSWLCVSVIEESTSI